MGSHEPVLILFAKKPIAGKVKTRLCPPLSSDQAQQVAIQLIKLSVETASAHWPGDIELCVWPDTEDEFLIGLSKQYDIELSTQVSGDLGRKMQVAMAKKVNMGHKAMVIGVDVPQCSAENLMTAYTALKYDKNVIGPTVDGGYYCIGVNNPDATMFDNVHWGSEMAYAQTLSSCARAGIKFDTILQCLNDLDNYEDLQTISKHIPQLSAWINEKDD